MNTDKEVNDAVEALQQGQYSLIADASRATGVSHERLRRRVHGSKLSNSRGGLNKALTPAQEEALCQFIRRCDTLGRPAKKRFIRAAANSICRQLGYSKPVSKDWTYRFLKWHPELHRKRTKPLSAERQAAQDKETIEGHFQKFEAEYKVDGFRRGYLEF